LQREGPIDAKDLVWATVVLEEREGRWRERRSDVITGIYDPLTKSQFNSTLLV